MAAVESQQASIASAADFGHRNRAEPHANAGRLLIDAALAGTAGILPFCTAKFFASSRQNRTGRRVRGARPRAREGSRPHTAKKPRGECPSAFLWRGMGDSLSPAGSVRVRSDSTPCCHSLRTRSSPPWIQKWTEINPVHICMARHGGLEPSTYWFVARHSIRLSYGYMRLRFLKALSYYTSEGRVCQLSDC